MIQIAVDWGSSSFRAYLFDSSCDQIDFYSSATGIKAVSNEDFNTVLSEQIGHWISRGDTILLAGMITSRNGWMESDYIPCPANLNSIVSHLGRLQLPDLELLFLPGVSQSDPPDVMRGEELQLLGAEVKHGEGLYIMPGTHSKWANVERSAVREFRTIPTGEIFDLVVNHSLMGALSVPSSLNETAFVEGVEAGFSSSTVMSDLFSARSSVILGYQTGNRSYSWISGLLIGSEIREGKSMMPFHTRPAKLIGSAELCKKYLIAFRAIGIEALAVDVDVTTLGFQKVIKTYQSREYE